MEFNLDKTSVKVLKYIADEHKTNPSKHIELLKIKFGDDLDMTYLLECGYVEYSSYVVVKDKTIHGDFYSITAKGFAYLELKLPHTFQVLYPIITSSISAITAIAAIIISILKP